MHQPRLKDRGRSFAARFQGSARQIAGIEAYRLLRWCAAPLCPGAPAATTVCQAMLCNGLTCVARQSPEQPDCLVARPKNWPGLRTTLCARLHLPTGETLALQLCLHDNILRMRPQQLDIWASLLLLWAREGLAREAAERQLARLASQHQAELMRALKINDEEREWVAYEVHDRVAQTLASAYQQCQALETLTTGLPQAHRIAVRNSKLLRETIRESRNIMNDLHPPILDELGLGALMEEELHRLEEDLGCRATARLPGQLQLPRALELVVYRIFHEALVNVRRHSQARAVSVSLACGPKAVKLRVTDNGVGFDVSTALASRRIGGLMSLIHRAELFGGECHLESTPGKGTTVSAWMPVHRSLEETVPWTT